MRSRHIDLSRIVSIYQFFPALSGDLAKFLMIDNSLS